MIHAPVSIQRIERVIVKNKTLAIQTPEWALPLFEPCRYKGAYGGRGSGKSHMFAEMLIEEHIMNPNQIRFVFVRSKNP
jgi:phage terminase large subunit